MRCPEKQQLVIFSIALAIIAGFTVFRYLPLARETLAVRQAKADCALENSKIQTQIGQFSVVREQKANLEAAVGDYDAKIPDSRQFAALWEQISEVMNAHDLKDQQIKPGVEVEDGQLVCIPLSIQCSGRSGQIFALLRSLESFERLIRIDSLVIGRLEGGKDEIKINADAKVFYRKIEEISL